MWEKDVCDIGYVCNVVCFWSSSVLRMSVMCGSLICHKKVLCSLVFGRGPLMPVMID